MTYALLYLAGMASMVVVLFLRGAREVSECQAHHEEVERLTRERDRARENAKFLADEYDAFVRRCECAVRYEAAVTWDDSPDRRGSTYLDLKLNPKYDKAFRFFTADEMRERFNEELDDLTDRNANWSGAIK